MGQYLRRVTSARVAQPNSAETDAMPKVMHLVSGREESGAEWTVKLMSSDPLAAMEEVGKMDDGAFQGLERVPAQPTVVAG